AIKAAALKGIIADSENLVGHQHVGVHARRDGKAETHVHAGGVVFHRHVDELLKTGEGYNLVETCFHLGAAEPEDGTVQEDVFPAGQLGVETGAKFQERRDAAADPHMATRRLKNPGEQFQAGAFPRAVGADYAQHGAGRHLKRDVAQRPENLVLPVATEPRPLQYLLLKRAGTLVMENKAL